LYTALSGREFWGNLRVAEAIKPLSVLGFLMSHNKPASGEAKSAHSSAKKPYHKPEFRYERAFETMALSCGKTNPQLRQCFLNQKRS
jgi:hypothetical protein